MNNFLCYIICGLNFFIYIPGSEADAIIHNSVVGDRVLLPCYYRSPYETAAYTAVYWFKDTSMIARGTIVLKDKAKYVIDKPAEDEWNLIINYAEQSDEAIYTCKIMEDNKTVKVMKRKLSVDIPVKAMMYQEKITAGLGEDVVMFCLIVGEPLIAAYWKDNHGDRIETSWHFNVTKKDEDGLPMQLLTLTILKAAFSLYDYGNYTCFVAGDNSEDESLVLLTRKEDDDKSSG